MPERGNNLVLLTSSFPFGKGEEFLETEIEYLAERFGKILVAPTLIEDGERSVPANVRIDTELAITSRPALRKAVAAAATCLVEPIFYLEPCRHLPGASSVAAIRHITQQLTAAKRVSRWLGAKVALGLDIDASLFYSYWFGPSALGLALFARRRPLRFIARAHRSDIYEELHPTGFLPYRRQILHGAHRLYCVSEHGQDYLAHRYARYSKKVRVARLGVRDPGTTCRASEDSILRIVSCSYLSPVKRIPLLIEGIRALAAEDDSREIQWNHIGGGMLHEEVRQLASLRLPDNVGWKLHGHLPNQQVREFYRNRAIDVFINVSESEGVPVSIMEAQSFGLPVIAPAVGGVPEIVNEQNGVLLPPNPTAQDIADSLRLFSNADAVAIQEKRVAAKCSWRERYDSDENYGRFATELVEVSTTPLCRCVGKPAK